MKVVYLAHPVRGDVPANLARARRWLRWAIDEHPDTSFIAPYIVECELFDDADDAQRERGIARMLAVIDRLRPGNDELWHVGGRVTSGMHREADRAAARCVRVRDRSHLGAEPPGLECW